MSSSEIVNKSVDLTGSAKKDGISSILLLVFNDQEPQKIDQGLIKVRMNEKTWSLHVHLQDGVKRVQVNISLRKGIIHRHLNILYKARAVARNALITQDWDWELYEQTRINFVRNNLPDSVNYALHHALLKEPVIIEGQDFDHVFSALFMLAAPLNSPTYNDSSWAYVFDESKGTPMFRFFLYPPGFSSDAVEYSLWDSLHDITGAVHINVDARSVAPNKNVAVLSSLNDAILSGGMDEISRALKSLSELAKRVQSFSDAFTVMDELALDKESAEFLLSLSKVFRRE